MRVCERVHVCVAMFLHRLIEGMLPLSSTTFRLPFYRHSVRLPSSRDSGEVSPCLEEEQPETPGVGSGRHQAKERQIQARGKSVRTLPACLVYYWALEGGM